MSVSKSTGQQNEQLNHVCSLCQNPPDENMVPCGTCHSVFHRECVQVSDIMIFTCPSCSNKRPNSPSSSSISKASNRSRQSQSRKVELQLQMLEEERELNNKYLKKKYQILEDAEDQSDISSIRSQTVLNWVNQDQCENRVPRKSNNNTLTNPTNDDNNSSLNRAAYLTTESSSIPKTVAPVSVATTISCQKPVHHISNPIPNSNVSEQTTYYTSIPNNFVPNVSQPITTCIDANITKRDSIRFVQPIVTSAITSTSIMSAAQPSTSNLATSSCYQQRLPPSWHTANTGFQNPGPISQEPINLTSSDLYHKFNTNPLPEVTSTQQPLFFNPNISYGTHTQTNNPLYRNSFFDNQQLPQSSLNARHSVPKELPVFSGNPEDWPLFISTFEWSTNVCRLTDVENLIRLQNSLKGDALYSVQHMLVHPSNVTCVIDILRMLYGQPEKILNSIKNRIYLSPKVDENNLKTLTTLAIKVRSLLSTIIAGGLNDELNNSSLLFELIQKLPTVYQMQWATQKMQLLNRNVKPNLCEFDKWLFNIGITASSITIDQPLNRNNEKKIIANEMQTINRKAFIHSHSENTCIVCGNNNNKCKAVANCSKYLSMDRGEKWSLVRKHNLCKYCLLKHNGECNKKKRCGKEGCEFFHHTSLHRYSEPMNKQNETLNKNVKGISGLKVVNNNHTAGGGDFVLFKIIPVKVYGENKIIETFAFIDEGSSISLINQSLAKELQVSGEAKPLCLRWTGGMERREENSENLKISISGNDNRQFDVNVYTVNALNLPVQSLNYERLSQQYHHLQKLPVESYINAEPQILIGLNHINLGVSRKIREGSPYAPLAVYTKLGWLIYGASEENKNKGMGFNFHVCECSDTNIDDRLESLVNNFYSIESLGIGVKDSLVAESDKRALALLNKFTKQKENGHYEVPLLWKYDAKELPDSYEMALKRLNCLENKLRKNVDLLKIFQETIIKHLSKSYIRKLDTSEIDRTDKMVWYLPIFAVFNKNKPGKSRVVWDAAAKSKGVSLNSYLLKGPDLLANLPAVLFKFRQKSIAVSGDIEEMFHQIHIRPEDRDVQRFLWRDCLQDKPPDIYVMDVMIFGASCAPSISQYVKNLNGSKYEKEFPRAAKAIKENHYVDDLLDSVDTPQEALKLISDVSYIHKKAGFNIRNWISNNKSVLTTEIATPGAKCLNLTGEKHIEKILGVFWDHDEDIITFKLSTWLIESEIFSGGKIPTKREVLRFVMSIYDPLGIIGHITMYVKVFMQEVWRTKIDWDEKIPPELVPKWNQWIKILTNIQNIRIPRCYLNRFKNYDNVQVELHTFVDASKNGYATVCYFRLKGNDVIVCSLVGSKTRVAPLKITSVPRLELMAALIGARFAKFIVENHDIRIDKTYFWCDSKTVLSWLSSDHRKYSQFVAFRITEILELSSSKDWKWIPSKQNVADDATKWSQSPTISNSCRWFQGPAVLFLPESEWPQGEAALESTEEEQIHHSFKIERIYDVFNFTRFSKWIRLVRTAAYVLRFLNNCRIIDKQKGNITQEELKRAEKTLYMQIQAESYCNEIFLLKAGKIIPKGSDIFEQNPYLDDGVLKVEGRIDNADISQDQKRPVILPRKSYTTELICMYYHEKFYHMNHETAINEIRQKYYVSKLRATFNSIIRRCQMCKIRKAMPQNPKMAKLPRARVAAHMAPFTYTGVDFFGPILVTVNRHKEKRYGCLFTCLTVRAVHIEIAHSLTTSSCILAIRNFMARRGIPQEWYSDNGTNFVGAERELREALADVDKDELVKTFTTTTTNWNFTPPASPHMGGAWERLIRSVKTILYKIMPSRAPSDELLLSMMIEVENVINSRPLAYIPIDGEKDEALTPNHFLIGSSSGLKPMSTCDDSSTLLKQSWLTSQQYANIFWKRWLAEYLPNLTCRSKWHECLRPLCRGDLVIIVDPSLPRNIWLRGKVLETRLASDGQVRSAKVLTQHGVLERPAVKLAVLDVAPASGSGGI